MQLHKYTHTQIHIHADFLLRVSVYVSVLGLQGFGMSLDPGLRHTRTGLPQDVKRVWCFSFSFSHRPWDTYRTCNTQLLRNHLHVIGLL